MLILKFGDDALENKEGYENVCSIASAVSKENTSGNTQDNDLSLIVASAPTAVTDLLFSLSGLAAKGPGAYEKAFSDYSSLVLGPLEALAGTPAAKSHKESVDTLLGELSDVLHGISLAKETSPRSSDLIMSFGERICAQTLTAYLKSSGEEAHFQDSREFIRTDSSFGRARVLFEETDTLTIRNFANTSGFQVVTGFIASNKSGETTTLGRGGSDYTALLLGAALGSEEVQIWTNTDGIMTAAPTKVAKAFSLPTLSYEEVMELTHFGANIIFPPTLQPARDKGVPIRVRNYNNPSFAGTVISSTPSPKEHAVAAVSSISNVSILKVQGSGMIGTEGVARRVFKALSTNGVNVIFISQASSEHSICLAVSGESGKQGEKALKEEFAEELLLRDLDEVSLTEDLSIIAVVGSHMRLSPGVSGKLFQALGKNGVNVQAIAQGSSELNISLVVSARDQKKALNAIHDTFFLSEVKTINLFLVGTGSVGSKLFEQVLEQQDSLAKKKLEVKLIGIANSRK